MKNIDNQKQSYRIYDKSTRIWFEVSPEQYKEFDRWRTNLRKREQTHGHCKCPRRKWWLCDGMCEDCEFRIPADTLSLDAPIVGKDGSEVTLRDTISNEAALVEEIVCDKVTLEQLIERLNELMPEAGQIGMLRLKGLSDETIAEIIGIKRTTFLSRLKKAKGTLVEEYPDAFE